MPKREEAVGAPLSPYAASKRAGEIYAQAFSLSYGLPTVGLRYFNVYGPRQDPESAYAAVIPLYFKAALTGKRPVVYGDGNQTRDFTWVGDVVDGTLRVADAPLPERRFEVVNVAAGRSVSVRQLWAEVARITGSTAEPDFLPPRAGDVAASSASPERLESWLNWVPQTRLAEGLGRAETYYRGLYAGAEVLAR
jgi:nucleoside-diphosphate-sugar epimerase